MVRAVVSRAVVRAIVARTVKGPAVVHAVIEIEACKPDSEGEKKEETDAKRNKHLPNDIGTTDRGRRGGNGNDWPEEDATWRRTGSGRRMRGREVRKIAHRLTQDHVNGEPGSARKHDATRETLMDRRRWSKTTAVRCRHATRPRRARRRRSGRRRSNEVRRRRWRLFLSKHVLTLCP